MTIKILGYTLSLTKDSGLNKEEPKEYVTKEFTLEKIYCKAYLDQHGNNINKAKYWLAQQLSLTILHGPLIDFSEPDWASNEDFYKDRKSIGGHLYILKNHGKG